jgi:HAD superfamily hydrolase (TIGR01509 family)
LIQAVIFDLDGVIIDSEPMHLEVDRNIIRSIGIDISDEELKKYIGVSNVKLWSDLVGKYKINHNVEELVNQQKNSKIKAFKENDLKPVRGVVELIDSIRKANLSLAIASSSPKEFIDVVLKRLDMQNKFEFILSGENFKKGKPEPDIFLTAAKLLGKSPEQCVVIEDSTHGITAAKRAGMKCIAYRNLGSGMQDLSSADLIIDSFNDISVEKILNLKL